MADKQPSKILLELCIGSAEDAAIAERFGADRVELCSALMLGGLTPSIGTILETKQSVELPVMVMIRPRGGGFCYTPTEMRVMLRDVDSALEAGADGIVFGILTEDGQVDMNRSRELISHIDGQQIVFHRAFDVVPDPKRALEQLIDLGVTRVLTSGQEDNAYSGASLIAELIAQAAGRIEILPGGGIDRFNLDDVLSRSNCQQVHIALPKSQLDPSVNGRPHVYFGGTLRPAEDRFDLADGDAVGDVVGRLSGQ